MILVTGGAGYIGSHTCVELLNAGHRVVVFDNFSNSSPEALRRIERITGKSISFVRGDIRDQGALEATLKEYSCTSVIHFAGLKAVGESVQDPLGYYDNNVVGTLCLLRAMRRLDVKALVFSSSATVYGEPQSLPLKEDHPLSVTNPYGRTKLMVEDILRDLTNAESDWRIGVLRYFNPVGAHSSGVIGEDPKGVPNNLMPYVCQVAVGRRPYLNVFGDDYPTHDGTGVRDYIHVVDLACAHLLAVQRLLRQPESFAVNLGTGSGISVLDLVRAFERVSNREIPVRIVGRRPGDVAACYADPSLAKRLLGWSALYDADQMCADAWNWQILNPAGFECIEPSSELSGRAGSLL